MNLNDVVVKLTENIPKEERETTINIYGKVVKFGTSDKAIINKYKAKLQTIINSGEGSDVKFDNYWFSVCFPLKYLSMRSAKTDIEEEEN